MSLYDNGYNSFEWEDKAALEAWHWDMLYNEERKAAIAAALAEAEQEEIEC